MCKKSLALVSFVDKYGGKVTVDVDEIVEMKTCAEETEFLQVYLECFLKSGHKYWLYSEVIFKNDVPRKYEIKDDMDLDEIEKIEKKNRLYQRKYLDEKKKEFLKKANYIQNKISMAKIGLNFIDKKFDNDNNANFYNSDEKAMLNIIYQENSGLDPLEERVSKEEDTLYNFRDTSRKDFEDRYDFDSISEITKIGE